MIGEESKIFVWSVYDVIGNISSRDNAWSCILYFPCFIIWSGINNSSISTLIFFGQVTFKYVELFFSLYLIPALKAM